MALGNVYLSFQSTGFSSGIVLSFDVLVGDNPPTVTGGYANWNTVKRPLQRSLTIFQGYDPLTMTADLRFGRWADNGSWLGVGGTPERQRHFGHQVEGDIRNLERMAGAWTNSGPPSVVYVWAHGAGGHDTPLIPTVLQKDPKNPMPWVITALSWGKAIRNTQGYRVWQDCTVTLENYLNLNKPPPPETSVQGGYFKTHPGHNTPLRIAGDPTSASPIVDVHQLARAICNDPKNNPIKSTRIHLKGKSLSYRIRNDVQVWVPGHQRN